MIRYVPLNPDTGYKFAFWNTVTDSFINIGPDQAWDDAADFNESAAIAKIGPIFYRRLSRLIPS